MPSLFEKLNHPDENSIKRFGQIKDMLDNETHFNPVDPLHRDLVNKCTQDLKDKLAVLKCLDQRIVAGFVLSATAFGLSFLLPIVSIAIVGFMFSVYCLVNRMNASPNYRYSLMTLEGCMEWTLGDKPVAKESEVINCPEVIEMFVTAAPLMNNKQLIDIIDDGVEDAFVAQAKEINDKSHPVFLGLTLAEEEKSIEYAIYGFQQGSTQNVIQGLLTLARKGWNTAQNAMKNVSQDNQPEAVHAACP